jgi:hypothetical protein
MVERVELVTLFLRGREKSHHPAEVIQPVEVEDVAATVVLGTAY